MNKCQQIQELLSDYRTGLLSGRKCADIEAHLANCPDCTREIKAIDDVLALVESNVPSYEPPVGLWNDVKASISAPEVRTTGIWNKALNLLLQPARVAGVGLATAAIVAGVIFGIGHKHPTTSFDTAENNEYIQGHAIYASQAPFADQVSYMTVAAASENQSESETK